MKACSWQELEQLAHTYSAHFNYVQVSALVCRLPKVVPDPSQLPQPEKLRFNRFLREISDLVTERLSTFDPRAIANVLWAVSKLGFSPAPPVLNKFLFEAYVRMYDFNAQELANLAWALAVLSNLGNRPVPVWLRKYTDAVMPRVPELKPMELAHLMWGLSKLFPPGAASPTASNLLQQPGIMSPAASGTGAKCSSASELAKSAAGATLHGQPSSALTNLSASSSPTGGPSTSANASADPKRAATTGPAGCSVSVADLPDLAASLTFHATTLIPHFSSGELVMSIVSLHTLDASAGFHLLRHALPRILSAAPGDMSPHDVCTVWLVLGKCATDSTLGRGLLPPVRSGDSGRPATSAATGAPSQCFTCGGGNKPVDALTAASEGAASACTLLKMPPPPLPPPVTREQLRALLDVVTAPVLQGSTAQGLCLLLWGWARLRLRPSDTVTEAVFQRFQEVLPAQATFQCVAISLWSAAQLGLRPPAAAMALFEACARLLLPASKPGERMALLWALQAMRYRPGRALMKALNSRLQASGEKLQPTEVQQVLSAYDVFGECAPVQVRVRALELASQVTTVIKAEARPAGEGAVSSGLPRPQGTLRTLQPLTPCAAVRYFATLVGLGVDTAANGKRRLAVERKLETLRWRLYHSRTRKLGLRDSIEDTVRGRLPELGNGSLCLLLAVMVRLRLKPRPAFIQEVYGEIAARAHSSSLQFWVAGSLVGSLGRLRPHLRPPQELLASLLAVVEPHLGSLADGHLLTLVQSLARLRYRPSLPWLRSYFVECMARLDGLSSAHLGLLMSSMVALGLRLRGTPCRKLQVVVFRRRRRGMGANKAEEGDELSVAAPSPMVKAESKVKKSAQSKGKAAEGVAAAAGEVDLRHTLCALCTELSCCTI